MTDMPKRIWVDKYDHEWESWPNDNGTEYIRTDSVPDVDVEDLAHEVRDAAFKTYGANIDPVWLERILRKALEVHSD